jgi:acyl carrier protein
MADKKNIDNESTIEEIEEKVKQVVASTLSIDQSKISNTSSFVDDLKADSLDQVELVMAFEDTFDCEIPTEDAERITSIDRAVDYVRDKKQSTE